MRDLKKTKLEAAWKTKDGVEIMQIRVGKRGGKYLAFRIETQFGLPGRPPNEWVRYVDFRDLNRNQLSQCCRKIGDLLTDGKIVQDHAEKILDLLYAELNSRFERNSR